jgi:hypothetical protein
MDPETSIKKTKLTLVNHPSECFFLAILFFNNYGFHGQLLYSVLIEKWSVRRLWIVTKSSSSPIRTASLDRFLAVVDHAANVGIKHCHTSIEKVDSGALW